MSNQKIKNSSYFNLMKHFMSSVFMVIFILAFSTNVFAAVKIPKKVNIETGDKYKVVLSGNKKSVKWSTSNKNVVSISGKKKNGVTVKGVKTGTAKVTAKIGSKKYTCTVKVKNPIPVLSATSLNLKPGATATLKVSRTAGIKTKVSSSNKGIAAIKAGKKNIFKVTAKKSGKATITVKVGKRKLKCTVIVGDVQPTVSYAITSCNQTIYQGDSGYVSFSSSLPSYSAASSNKGVVQIAEKTPSAVRFIGKSCGTATITVTISTGQTLTTTVQVMAKTTSQTSGNPGGGSNSGGSGNSGTSSGSGSGEIGGNTGGSGNDSSGSGYAYIPSNLVATCKLARADKGYAFKPSDFAVFAYNKSGKATYVSSGYTVSSKTVDDGSVVTIEYSGYKTEVTVPEYTYAQNRGYSLNNVSSGAIVKWEVYTANSGEKIDPNITFSLSNNKAELCLSKPRFAQYNGYNCAEMEILGVSDGDVTVTAKTGNGKVIYSKNLHVNGNDEYERRRYNAWRKKVEQKVWTSGMSSYEKICAIGDYLLINYPTYAQGTVYNLANEDGKGCDCVGSSRVLVDTAEDLGIKACLIQSTGSTWPGHTLAKIWIGNKIYIVECTCGKDTKCGGWSYDSTEYEAGAKRDGFIGNDGEITYGYNSVK